MRRFLVLGCLCLMPVAIISSGCSPKDATDSTSSSGDATTTGGSTDETSATDPPALSAEDQALADAQKICPVSDADLGSMGTPIKVMVGDRPVFICCAHCQEDLLADADTYLAKLDATDANE